jgi:hypothetical protein
MNLFLACAACYGQSDSAMAAGMNWGIVSLLGMIVLVLGGVAGFFVFLARRSSAMAKRPGEPVSPLHALEQNSADGAEGFKAPSSPARSGFGRVSALAQQRNRCAQSRSEPGQLLAPRGRN